MSSSFLNTVNLQPQTSSTNCYPANDMANDGRNIGLTVSVTCPIWAITTFQTKAGITEIG